jgi:N-acetylneuraminic acid mutarotase
MKFFFLNLFNLFLLFCSCKKDNNVAPQGWKLLAPMPTARHDFGFVVCNDLFYAIGGYNADGLNKVETYDPVNDIWSTKATMPTARGYLVVAVVANKIYAIGGLTGSDLNNITYTNVTEEYDPATNTWTEKSPLPITAIPFNQVLGNRFITGTAINGKIYVVVGDSEGDQPTYMYDPATDTWTIAKSAGKFNLEPYYSTVAGDGMYVNDGLGLLQYLSSQDEWRELQPPSTSLHGACLASDNDNIYVIGGYNRGVDYETTNANVEVYNITSSSWTKTSSLEVGRNAAGAVVYNNNLYVAGGSNLYYNNASNGNVPLSSVEVLSLK